MTARWTRPAVAAAALLLFSLAIACTSTSSEPGLDTEVRPPQRIVFVAPDHAVFTVDKDGSNQQPLLDNIAVANVSLPFPATARAAGGINYFWPTWSPAGDGVAVSRTPGTVSNSPSAIVVASAYSEGLQMVHNAVPGAVTNVANNAPHYVQWSPDRSHLTFLAAGADIRVRGLEMFVVNAQGAGEPHFLASRVPVYHVWTPNSSAVLIHSQEALLRYTVADDRWEDLGHRSLLYRTPAISPTGDRYAFVTEDSGASALAVWSVAEEALQRLLDVDQRASFLWSPIDDVLAVTVRSVDNPGLNRGVVLFDLDTGESQTVTDDDVIAFFWSPDGQRRAIAEHTDGPLLRWLVVAEATSSRVASAPYIPSSDYATLLSFFDQYAYSHSPWSPDSSSLVFAGRVPATDQGTPPDLSLVYVLDLDAGEGPGAIDIAEGGLAFWVPSLAR